MATRYVRTNGADGTGGHDGTTPALAWLTLGYAMTNVSAGDTIWVGAGTYRVSSAIAPSSMASMTYLYGDTDGSRTGDAGEVIVTNYGTNDTTAPASCDVFAFASKTYWTLGKLTIQQGGTGTYKPVNITVDSDHITIQDCVIYQVGNGAGVNIGSGSWRALTVTVERCLIASVGPGAGVWITCPVNGTGADLDLVVVVRNCVIFAPGPNGAVTAIGGTNTFHSGGITLANCTVYGGYWTGTGTIGTVNPTSTTYKLSVYNSLIFAPLLGFVANAANQIAEDYNVILSPTAYTNVTGGANSKTDGSRNWRFSLGHEWAYGAIIRSLGELPSGSPLLAWGTSGSVTVTDDLRGNPRPGSGAASVSKAIGAYERANSGTKTTSTVRTGSNALQITGPGLHDFDLPVAAASTTVTVYAQFDANYGAGTKPTMSVRNGGECGVADATATMTVASGNWEQLSLNFTPTAVGIVTIRLASLGSAATGITFFDDFAAA